MAQKYKQQKNGLYRTTIWDGTYKDGEKHYVWLTSSKSSKDLERMVAEYKQKRDNGLLTVSQAVTVQEYARKWLATEKGLSESATKAMYANIIEKHLKSFELTPFEHFTRASVQLIINDTKDAPRTCQQIVMVLKQISRAAEADRLIPAGKTASIFDNLQLPKYKPREKNPLTDEECSAVYDTLVAHVLPPRSALFLALIYFCGLRREEAVAVKFSDIHSLSVSVNKAFHVGDTFTEVKGPKTERGERTVPLPPEAIPLIHGAVQELEPNADGYLFVMKDGSLITKSSYRRMWEGIQKALDFECTAHQFRHTYCTRLCYEAYENRTISVKQIARLMGDTEHMVTNIYSHIVEEREQTSAALANIFVQRNCNMCNENATKKQPKMAINAQS